MQRTNLLVIDHPLFRAGLRTVFAGTPYKILGEAGTFEAAYLWLRQLPSASPRPNILLADPEAGQVPDDFSWPCRFRIIVPQIKTIILSDSVPHWLLARGVCTQIVGHLRKDVSAEALIRALDLIVLGQLVLPGGGDAVAARAPCAENVCMGLSRLERLSPREIEVLRHLVGGHSNKRIAQDLRISDETVRVHLKALLRKTNAINRTQAAIWAVTHGYGGKSQRLDMIHSSDEARRSPAAD
jgi:two-component system nitrate/nitrite response regulator NarL